MRLFPMLLLAAASTCCLPSFAGAATEPDVAGVEFFERRIRPLLVEHCHTCHGPQRQRSGLVLSTAVGITQGGDRGPAIVAGSPDQSLLLQAVGYEDNDLRMPPKGKLRPEQIADLTAWVERGAPLPPDVSVAGPALSEFDLEQRRRHWAYQPVRSSPPPSTSNSAWCVSSIDRFLLARLDAAGLKPASPAEKRTLIRRLTFDLIGLPPAPDDVAAFVEDISPDAYERLVERLLASPHYGPRWARHWLDVVRYAETWGFEFDYDLHNAWQYRDYCVRAFNEDLPYDQFVIEHLAGDLLPQPRRRAGGGTNESILATGFFWMGEGKQSPIDLRQEQADRIDNQIDVLGKALLGQTVACARCHDHKFDAISTRDYYALAGYLKSSRYQQAFLDPPERIEPHAQRLAEIQQRLRSIAAGILTEAWQASLGNADRYLLAARSALANGPDEGLQQAAVEFALPERPLERWIEALRSKTPGIDHPLHAWLALLPGVPSSQDLQHLHTSLTPKLPHADRRKVFADFRRTGTRGWYVTGEALRTASAAGILLASTPERPIAQIVSPGVHSGLLSRRLQGEMRSATFTIERPFIHFRLAGQSARVNLVIDGYTLIMNPMYGKLTISPNETPTWWTMPVDRWLGHRAYIEACDSSIPLHGLNPPPSTARVMEGPQDGYLWLEQIVFSEDAEPPVVANSMNINVLTDAAHASLESLAANYQHQMTTAVARWQADLADPTSQATDRISLLNWLLDNQLLDVDTAAATRELHALGEEHRAMESTLPTPTRAPALADGTGEDEHVFLRGNYRTPGERAPRGPPEVLACSEARSLESGSGRLDLARQLVDPANPLVARVMVNRLWQHHFGEGLVRTPDDFGRMGLPPTHPELLDYLAAEFVASGWSLKAMHRLMLNSSAYRMASAADTAMRQQVDPENRLLSHAPVRRLEAETVRDALLALAGRLHPTLEGPSVLPYLTAHMEGRGRPQSGPLDGEGRRSIYINARRNFLTPMFVAFDYPAVFTTVGRRGVTTVPTQALTLMNDPFVIEQARAWSQRVRASTLSSEARVAALYQAAFARDPSEEELRSALAFVRRHSGDGPDEAQAWADLCHVLINVKEFIYIH